MRENEDAIRRAPSVLDAFLGRAAFSKQQKLIVDIVTDFGPPLALSGVGLHELLYNMPGWTVWALVAVIIWPLVWRRRAPVIVFAVSLAAVLVLSALGQDSFTEAALLVALYSVAAHRRFLVALVCAVLLEFGVFLVSFKFAPRGSIDDAVVLLTGTAAAMLFLGTTLRGRRGYLASVEDRAERLELEREQQAQLAALAERARIAREMHDIVAHGLSVVITLSEGAAATIDTDPARSKAAMREVAAGGRRSLAEMRKLFDVLRSDEDPARSPQPDLSRLAELVSDVERTGLAVNLNLGAGLERLSESAGATLYRIVQEALTNVVRHAPTATIVLVDIEAAEGAARFAVENNGGGTQAVERDWPRSGKGLSGMRERVALFDGTVQAGPTNDGWLVSGELRWEDE